MAIVCGCCLFLTFAWIVERWLTAEHYLYINEGTHHQNDAATELSIRIGRMRDHIDYSVVILRSLAQDRSLENEAADLFRKYKIGNQTDGKGLLILFVEDRDALKIELSQSLEPYFTDSAIGALERAARTNMLSNRPADYFTELIITLNMHYEKKIKAEEFASYTSASIKAPSLLYSAGGGFLGKGYAATLKNIAEEVGKLPDRKGYEPSKDPDVTIEAYIKSLGHQIGDPDLPLLTTASRAYRIEQPQNRGQLQRNYDYYQGALPYRFVEKKGIAYALFQQKKATLPITLIEQPDGTWQVNEPSSWALFQRYEDSSTVYVKYPGILKNGLLPVSMPHGAPLRPSQDPIENLHRLETGVAKNPDNKNYLALAEALYADFYWLNAAIPLYENIFLDKRQNYIDDRGMPEYLWHLQDAYLANSNIDGYLKTWDRLACIYEKDFLVAVNREFYHANYDFSRWHWSQDIASFQKNPFDLRLYAAAYLYKNFACPIIDWWHKQTIHF
jgi:hypothetical protein